MVIRDLAIQKRDREMAIGTYARGFWIADIGPIKEFKPEVFQSPAFLFEPTTAMKWNRFDRRGDTLGEMVKADNPQVGANIYYYLAAEAKNVKVTIKDLEGNVLQDLSPTGKKGLQKIFWNLNRQAPQGQPPVTVGRRRRWRRRAVRPREPGGPWRLQGHADGGRQGDRHEEVDRSSRSAVQIARPRNAGRVTFHFLPVARGRK